MKELLKDNPELCEEIEAKIMEKLAEPAESGKSGKSAKSADSAEPAED